MRTFKSSFCPLLSLCCDVTARVHPLGVRALGDEPKLVWSLSSWGSWGLVRRVLRKINCIKLEFSLSVSSFLGIKAPVSCLKLRKTEKNEKSCKWMNENCSFCLLMTLFFMRVKWFYIRVIHTREPAWMIFKKIFPFWLAEYQHVISRWLFHMNDVSRHQVDVPWQISSCVCVHRCLTHACKASLNQWTLFRPRSLIPMLQRNSVSLDQNHWGDLLVLKKRSP